MTKQGLILLTAVLVSACGESTGGAYCDDHYEVHSDHLDSVAELAITISDDGELLGSLQVPRSALNDLNDEDIGRLFRDTDKSFVVDAEKSCTTAAAAVRMDAASIDVQFSASCGVENKLGKINVTLFDNVDDLEELVASITTTATKKRFGISRQCDAPMFRLEKIAR